jgi:hypothetical protein
MDAVFELSLRFAEPFKISDKLSPLEKVEAERLMFLELTQGLKRCKLWMLLISPDNQFASGETRPTFLFSST